MRLLAAFAWACLLLCFGALPGHAEKRVALVIGNEAYQGMPRLKNPVRDASEIEATLKRLGFATTKLINVDARALNDGLKRFAQGAAGAEAIFVFYSGHGAQLDGRTWLLPVDARLETKEDVNDADLLALDRILTTLREKSAVRIVVLDACRDNPVVDTLNLKIAEARGLKSAAVTKGLGRPLTAMGDLVVYATQAGAVAADGDGANSPFTQSLLKHLETSDLDVRQMFFRVQDDVGRRFKQLPEVSNSIIGEFKLKVTAAAPHAAPPGGVDEAERTWPFVKDTSSAAVLEDFIRRYGDTIYGTLARDRLEELKKKQVATVVPPAAPPSPLQPAVGVFPSDSVVPLSAERERGLKPKDVFKECEKCPDMVVVPAGSFRMGSPASEVERSNYEGPQHSVKIAKPFAAGQFHVAVDQFAAFVTETGYDAASKCIAREGGKWVDVARSWRTPGFTQAGSHPAVCLNWDDAKAYVGWIAKKTGKDYRLLTEAESEYAARAGTTTPFWWGASISTSQANYDGNSIYGGGAKGEWLQKTIPVDSFQPNSFGLYQVHGNAHQWVEDCWHSDYQGAPSDGSAWVAAYCSQHVLRGGSWLDDAVVVRAGYRTMYATVLRLNYVGFRLGRTLAR